MKYLLLPLAVFAVLFIGCENEDELTVINQGDYPVKEYYLERNPSVNPWGVGMDFIHDECNLKDTELDYLYFTKDTSNEYDINLFTVKAYYTNSNGDTKSEGCPALLLGEGVTACKVGEGIDFFDSLTVVTPEMTSSLVSDPKVSYDACKNENGHYDRQILFASLSKCVIGQSFRGNVLVVPEGKSEEEVQAVYLIKTSEGGYAKFMVRKFKPAKPNEKQTLVRWQVISE